MRLIAFEGAVEIEDTFPRRQYARRAIEQAQAGFPRRNMNHVGGNDGSCLLDGPFVPGDVNFNWWQQVRRARIFGMSCDAGACVFIEIARLPLPGGKAWREEGGVFAGAAVQFENQPVWR